MWQLDYKESWMPKNWCFWTVVLEKTLESPLDCKDIQPVHPKGDQSWVFTGRTDVEAENSSTLATWCKELTHLKRPWCWEGLRVGGEGDDRRLDGITDSMDVGLGWLGVGNGQGGLACCSSWGCKESDMTEWLNWTDNFTPRTTTVAIPLIQALITSCPYETVLPCLPLSASLPPSYSYSQH